MPAVRDLDGARQGMCSRLAAACATIAGHDRDPGMPTEPRGHGGDLTIRQQCDRTPTLEVDDNRSIAAVASERLVVDADDAKRQIRLHRPSPHDPQQRVVADRQHEASGKTGARPTAQRQAEMMDNGLQPLGPSSSMAPKAGDLFFRTQKASPALVDNSSALHRCTPPSLHTR